jgi:LDH2 family malate/lactate/ureidoglycolate dehydrogenase
MGMVASYRMMEMLIEKAKTYGMAGGAIKNSTHYGIAGYWTTMAEKAGMIGITGTNARPSVAPTFGVEPMMGTNPMTFTMPTDEDFPYNFDCATSIVQNGKIEYYERMGKETPAGLVVTKDGGTMTDSGKILKDMRKGECALLSIGGLGEATGGYKGYGFTTIVEILSAALAGGPFMKALSGKDEEGNNRMYRLGHFFFVINPEFFMGLDTFKKTTGDILRGLRASEKAPGEERIYTAGEKEWDAWCERKDKGVPVNESVQNDLLTIRDRFGLDYTFPFE